MGTQSSGTTSKSSFVFCEYRNFGCSKVLRNKGGLISHCEVCEYKPLSCFLGESCHQSVIPVNYYTQHFITHHQYRLYQPLLPWRAQFCVTYKLKGAELCSETIIWKCGEEKFIPIGRFNDGQFSFGLIWIGIPQPQQRTISVKMKVTKPGGQKFRNFAQNAVKLQVPITPIRVSLDGTLDLKASECVVLKKEELEEFCKKKKSAKEDVNLEEWRWILCSRRT